jgi:hypothetical protein
MPEQPLGAPRLPDDFDESRPGLPFRRAPDPRSQATPLGKPGEFMTDATVLAAQKDWLDATGPGRLVAGPNPGEFITAEEAERQKAAEAEQQDAGDVAVEGDMVGAPEAPSPPSDPPAGLTVT